MCRELHMQIELRDCFAAPHHHVPAKATDEWDPSQSRIEPSQRLPPNKAIFRLFIDALPVPVLIGMDPIYGIVLQEQGQRENPEFLCARHLRDTALPGEHPEMKWGHPGCTLTPLCVGPWVNCHCSNKALVRLSASRCAQRRIPWLKEVADSPPASHCNARRALL